MEIFIILVIIAVLIRVITEFCIAIPEWYREWKNSPAQVNKWLWEEDLKFAAQAKRDYEYLTSVLPTSEQFLKSLISVTLPMDDTQPPEHIFVPIYSAAQNMYEKEFLPPLPRVTPEMRETPLFGPARFITDAILQKMRDGRDPQKAYELLFTATVNAVTFLFENLPKKSTAPPLLFAWPYNLLPRAEGLDKQYMVLSHAFDNEPMQKARVFLRHHRPPEHLDPDELKHPDYPVKSFPFSDHIRDFLVSDIPISIDDKIRFEHMWLCAGTGHGKTQTIQSFIRSDLPAIIAGQRSVVIIDSQSEMIGKLSRLKIFKDHPEKLVLIDPTDVEYPVALNFFDLGRDRMRTYSQLDRERLFNGAIELLEFTLGTLLQSEMTSKQTTMFRFILRAMFVIPNATIHTLIDLLGPDGSTKYAVHLSALKGAAAQFFDTEFDSKEFQHTRREVVRRMWGILSNDTFARMFSHPKNKLDLFEEMQQGKLILINTSKELLKSETGLFGRFFIALIQQCAQERAALPPNKRTPTFVFIDEFQDYLPSGSEANVATLFDQGRKFKIGLTVAHHYLGQLSPKLQDTLSTNTSIKFVGGVSADDARKLSRDLHCEPEFIQALPTLTFAAYIKGLSRNTLSLKIQPGIIEKIPPMTPDEWRVVRADIRRRYSVVQTQAEAAYDDDLSTGTPPPRSEVPRGSQTRSPSDPRTRPRLTGKDPDIIDMEPTDKW